MYFDLHQQYLELVKFHGSNLFPEFCHRTSYPKELFAQTHGDATGCYSV